MCLRDPVCNLWASHPSRLLCIFSLWALSRLTYRRAFLNFSPSLGRIISCNCGLGVREAVKIIKCFLRCKVPALSGPFHSEKDARDAIRVSTTQLSRPTFTMNWPRDAAGLTEHWLGKTGRQSDFIYDFIFHFVCARFLFMLPAFLGIHRDSFLFCGCVCGRIAWLGFLGQIHSWVLITCSGSP